MPQDSIHHGSFQVGHRRFEDTILTVHKPHELRDGQKLGWVCPCCTSGFLASDWSRATGELRRASCRKHRLDAHRDVPLQKWYRLIRVRSACLPSRRAIMRDKNLSKSEAKAHIPGQETFLWPRWEPGRKAIQTMRRWRCATRLHVWLHRACAVKHVWQPAVDGHALPATSP